MSYQFVAFVLDTTEQKVVTCEFYDSEAPARNQAEAMVDLVVGDAEFTGVGKLGHRAERFDADTFAALIEDCQGHVQESGSAALLGYLVGVLPLSMLGALRPWAEDHIRRELDDAAGASSSPARYRLSVWKHVDAVWVLRQRVEVTEDDPLDVLNPIKDRLREGIPVGGRLVVERLA